MGIVVTWALYTLALIVVSRVLRGFEIKGGLASTIVVAALFGCLNWALGWLITFLLGLFTLTLAWVFGVVTQIVVVALILELTDTLSDRLEIRSFWVSLVAAAIINLTVALATWVLAQIGVAP